LIGLDNRGIAWRNYFHIAQTYAVSTASKLRCILFPRESSRQSGIVMMKIMNSSWDSWRTWLMIL